MQSSFEGCFITTLNLSIFQELQGDSNWSSSWDGAMIPSWPPSVRTTASFWTSSQQCAHWNIVFFTSFKNKTLVFLGRTKDTFMVSSYLPSRFPADCRWAMIRNSGALHSREGLFASVMHRVESRVEAPREWWGWWEKATANYGLSFWTSSWNWS